ncbi:MAG: M48 family metalloprotease [Candidatus Aminicenantes bacterium]|nr:M48 family metalloprotease [Candidatus Aminicenantes bacterium]
MKKRTIPDFYETQRQQWKKSLFLLLVLFLFYIFAVGMVAFVFVLSFGLLFKSLLVPSGSQLLKIILLIGVIALLIALYHFYDAKKFGAKFIRKRMQAASPDQEDRYHKQFANTVEEIRLATGLPMLTPYIIPSFAINSMALIEADNTPSILVTEGLLAEFTRDELGAVVAHETAHVLRGDTFYITLVCSLANFFERLRQATEPDTQATGHGAKGQEPSGGAPLVYVALTISYVVMHLLSTLISREREILADAAAVEFSRNPRALARAIYKAHLKNSFVGDFNLTYSPLFIVPPRSVGMQEGFFGRIFNSHPPLMQRIKLLARMVPTSPAKIIDEVWEIQRNRDKAREVLLSRDEGAAKVFSSDKAESSPQGGNIWAVRNSKGKWQGPFTLEELLFLPFFTPLLQTKNLQEGIVAQAVEFPQIRNARRNLLKKKPIDSSKHNLCPRCRTLLREHYYEGVSVRVCRNCDGKLIDTALVERIIARKEVAFSERLIQKARAFRQEFMLNPTRFRKLDQEKSPKISCPECGNQMLLRPYSYHYIIPVDKCLICHKTWFDSDELEILQILIEFRQSSP